MFFFCSEHRKEKIQRRLFVIRLIAALMILLFGCLSLVEANVTRCENSTVHSSSLADQGGKWDYCFYVSGLEKWCCFSGDVKTSNEGSQLTMTMPGITQQCSTQEQKEAFSIAGNVFVFVGSLFLLLVPIDLFQNKRYFSDKNTSQNITCLFF